MFSNNRMIKDTYDMKDMGGIQMNGDIRYDKIRDKDGFPESWDDQSNLGQGMNDMKR